MLQSEAEQKRLEAERLTQKQQCAEAIASCASVLAIICKPKNHLYDARLEEVLVNFIRKHTQTLSKDSTRPLPSCLNIPELREGQIHGR